MKTNLVARTLSVFTVISIVGIFGLHYRNNQLREQINFQYSPEKRSKAYTFVRSDINGRVVDVNQSKTVLIFLSSKCETCVNSFGDYNAFYDKLKVKDVKVIGISPESPDTLRIVAKKHDLKIPLLSDQSRELFLRYSVRWVPVIALINEKGRFEFYSDYENSTTECLKIINGLISK